jgi:hypothetical protein
LNGSDFVAFSHSGLALGLNVNGRDGLYEEADAFKE